MGQAKNRGAYEERKALSMAKAKSEKEAKELELDARTTSANRTNIGKVELLIDALSQIPGRLGDNVFIIRPYRR